MSNPARRLYEIFEAWGAGYGPGSDAMKARGLDGLSDEAYDRQVESFKMLIAIDHALTYLEKSGVSVPVYRFELKSWIKMAIHAPNSWQGASNKATGFPSQSMAHLNTLATLLDVNGPRLKAEPEQTLRDVINQVLSLLAEDGEISDTLRGYLYKLARELQTALDDESVLGTFDFAEAAERLWVGLHAAAGQSAKHGSAWKGAAARLFRDAGATALGSLPAMALTMVQVMAAGA